MAASELDLQKLYIAYFNRCANHLGLDYWMGRRSDARRSPTSALQFAKSMFSQTEFQNTIEGSNFTKNIRQGLRTSKNIN